MISDLLRAEAVAFPLASWSGIRHEVSALECDDVGAPAGNNESLAKEFESHMLEAYRGEDLTVDQINRLQRRAWYGNVPAGGVNKYLEDYLRHLTGTLIEFYQEGAEEGFFLSEDVDTDFWRQLSTKISPDLLLAAAALDTTNGHELLGQSNVRIRTPFLDPPPKLVEQHVHLGACLPFNVLWVQALKYEALRQESEVFKTRDGKLDLRPLLIRAAVVRMILVPFLASYPDASITLREYIEDPPDKLHINQSRWIERVFRDACDASTFWSGAENKGKFSNEEIQETHSIYLEVLEADEYTLQIWAETLEAELDDWLCLHFPESLEGASTAEPYLLYSSLEHLRKRPDDDHFRAMFWQLMRCKNLFYQRLVQQEGAPGLAYFRWFYDQSRSHKKFLIGRPIHIAEAHLNQNDRLNSLELRCAPARINEGERHRDNQKREFKDYVSDYSKLLTHKRDHCPRIGLIIHFLKRADNGQPTSGCSRRESSGPLERKHRYEDYFEEVWDQMDACAYWLVQEPALSHFFRGLDVASQERAIPNWVFAPVFREFRKRVNPRNISDRRSFQQLHLTAHLGEDFVHPISGLRRIHEGLEYFELESRDRIGHAIALGLDIEKWAERYGKRTIPLDEYLDDLAWEWWLYNFRKEPADDNTIRFLENEFLRNTNEILNSWQCEAHRLDSAVNLREWAGAYHLRHDEDALIDLKVLTREKGQLRTCKTRLQLDFDRIAGTKKVLESYLYCEKLWRAIEFSDDVEVTIDERYVKRAQDIQEWLQNRFNGKGLIAEACPTANVVIAKLGSYANHPAFQFDDPRTGVDKVRFTVNADNPLTFNTTVEDELAHLYRAFGEFSGNLLRPEDWVRKRCGTATQTSFVVPHTVNLDEHKEAIERALRFLEDPSAVRR